MMQIGGVDNLVLKDVKLPSEAESNEKKVRLQEENSKVKEDAAAKAQTQKDDKKAEETERSVYGDIVGRSSDGDTSRVKKDAMEAFETGMVMKKEERDENLMEFNRDQLTVMVDKGDITENRYDHEITRRDELQEKDEKSAFAKTNAEMIENQKKVAEKKAREKAKERLDEIQGKDKQEEEAKKLENGMNTLAASQKGLEIEEEAVVNAAQNGRSDVIDQILNPEDGSFRVITSNQ